MDKITLIKELYQKLSETELYDITTYKYGTFTSKPFISMPTYDKYINLELKESGSLLINDIRYEGYMEIDDIVYLSDKQEFANSEKVMMHPYYLTNYDIYEILAKEKSYKNKKDVYRIYIPNHNISKEQFNYFEKCHIEYFHNLNEKMVDVPYFKDFVTILKCEEFRNL